MDSKKIDELSSSNYFLILILITILVLGATFLIGKNLVASIALNTKVINAKQSASNTLSDNLNSAPKLVDAYNALGSSSQLVNDALPSTVDFPALLITMENLSGVAGVTLKSIDPVNVVEGSASSAAGSSKPYTFTATFSATYPTYLKLLSSIQTSVRPIHVDSAQVAGTGSALSVTMQLTTYYQDKAKLPISTEVITK